MVLANALPYEYYMNEGGSITNSKLNVVSSEKNLGVWITLILLSKLDFTLQCNKASTKAVQSLN